MVELLGQSRSAEPACPQPLSVLPTRLFQLQSLQSENTSLRRQGPASMYQVPGSPGLPDPSSPSGLTRRQAASRPMSMYETGSGLKPCLPKGETPYPEEGLLPALQPFPSHVSKQPCNPASTTSSPSSHVLSLSLCLSPPPYSDRKSVV